MLIHGGAVSLITALCFSFWAAWDHLARVHPLTSRAHTPRTMAGPLPVASGATVKRRQTLHRTPLDRPLWVMWWWVTPRGQSSSHPLLALVKNIAR